MHILITGGTGFIGRPLVEHLLAEGHSLTILTRQSLTSTQHCRYIASFDALDTDTTVDAVINLAGESLAEGRWTAARRRELWASRVELTENLVAALGQLSRPPRVMLSGSAVGYYGHPEEENLVESAPPGNDFASRLCQAWEAEAAKATALGTRVCTLRLGVVLDAGGGALEQMSLPFRLGVASWPGSGHQVLSWIHRADVVAAIDFLLGAETLDGPHNLTAPGPVSQRSFCAAMREHFRTWVTLPAPGPVLRLALGPMADALLLRGAHVVPGALLASDFHFQYPAIQQALGQIYASRHA